MGASLPVLTELAFGGSEILRTYGVAQAERADAEFQRRAMERHAALLERARVDRLRAGEREAGLQERRAAGVVGAQRAALAASGVDVNTGSAALIQQVTSMQGREEANTVRINAFREALGYKLEAEEERGRAGILRAGARSRQRLSLATGGFQLAKLLYRTGLFDSKRASDPTIRE